MEARVQSLREHLYSRRCVACGFDGPLIENDDLQYCIACGTDLRFRPPRSYAEMEGFLGQAVTIDSPLNDPHRRSRLLRNWLLFMLGVLAGMLTIGVLAGSIAVT